MTKFFLKLFISFLVIIITYTLILFFINFNSTKQHFTNTFQKDLKNLNIILTEPITNYLIKSDTASIKEYVNQVNLFQALWSAQYFESFRRDPLTMRDMRNEIPSFQYTYTSLTRRFESILLDFFLLTGVCGAKNKEINIGDIFLINKAIQNDSKKKFYPDIIFNHNLKESSIESFGKVINSYSSDIEGELIDMESAYFLEAAQFFSSPHKSHVLKIVSDHLDVGNITKEFISKIIEKNLKNINEIINSLQELHNFEQKETISIEENEFLLAIKENLNLTEYMKNELFSLYKIAKVRKNFSIENLKKFLQYKAKTKQERKKYYDNLKNSLL